MSLLVLFHTHVPTALPRPAARVARVPATLLLMRDARPRPQYPPLVPDLIIRPLEVPAGAGIPRILVGTAHANPWREGGA